MAKKSTDPVAADIREDETEKANESGKTITNSLLQHVASIVESCNATALFVYVDALDGPMADLGGSLKARMFCVTKGRTEEKNPSTGCLQCLRIPNVPLTRMGQVKIAVFLALSRGLIKHGDRIVFLSGLAATKTLDTIIVTEVGREYEIFTSGTDLTQTSSRILPEVIERVVDIASELGSEGREGRALGAMFVVGDTERVIPLTRQFVLNPFRGYPPNERNILDASLEETVKELATLDGAFIVRSDGVMETCGAYVRTASQEEFELPRGLGARHHAAAAISAVTDSIAVTVSESTGSVTIFRGGRIVTEIQKPRSTRQKSRLLRTYPQKNKKRTPSE
ncbi:MAG: diadenylate cyclase [Sedimentisphaerales bacterium]|nr:diadenylate cyclase [Sedimentisphaerales bacterium]